ARLPARPITAPQPFGQPRPLSSPSSPQQSPGSVESVQQPSGGHVPARAEPMGSHIAPGTGHPLRGAGQSDRTGPASDALGAPQGQGMALEHTIPARTADTTSDNLTVPAGIRADTAAEAADDTIEIDQDGNLQVKSSSPS
ncbi:MAG TPA: hypothetical protein VK983_04610, partial [Candidatus Limnocylindrales bacterium]|nr:hypothetical protein [Candidatus Limnocylindrales bacterium]